MLAIIFAAGTPIWDGGIHTVGNAPPGSVFHGVTTLAGLAALDFSGTRPFVFLTEGGLTTGPLATPGSRVNPFVSLTGAYRLTDADTGQIDIAWLALQAALLTGQLDLPSGTYIIGSEGAAINDTTIV